MAGFAPLGVSAVVDGYRDYINKVGKMATATQRSHSTIASLGKTTLTGLVKGAGIAAGAIVAIGAAATGALAAVGGLAAKLAIDGTPLVDMELGFNAIAENAGRVGSEVLSAMQDITAGTIRAADLMQLYNKGTTLLGENFEDIIPIMDQIIAQGAAIGLSPLQAVNDFTTGVARESKMILDNLGIIVNLDDATTAYAATLGKTADELSATERQSAILSAAQTSLEKTSKALPSLNDFASTSLARMKVQFQETRDEISKSLVPVLKEFIDELAGPLAEGTGDIVAIFKRDFIPTISEMARFLAANLPKAINFAKVAFLFLGRIIQGLWKFMTTFLIPGFNWLYSVFVDDILPVIQDVIKFVGGLFDSFSGGLPTLKEVTDGLLAMIPQPVLDAWDWLKTKAGEWYDVAKEWVTTHGPDFVQAFTEVRDYIVNDFIPNALVFLSESFTPVIESAGKLWDALVDRKPDVIKAWEEIKTHASDIFGVSIPLWLADLRLAWDNLIIAITGGTDKATGIVDTWGGKFIETLGDIVKLGLDVLNLAISDAISLIALLATSLSALVTGDWSIPLEVFKNLGDRQLQQIAQIGATAFDILGIGNGQLPTTGGSTFHQSPQSASIAARLNPLPTSPLHSEANTQNFSLTVNTSAPMEPVVADFRMMASSARRSR